MTKRRKNTPDIADNVQTAKRERRGCTWQVGFIGIVLCLIVGMPSYLTDRQNKTATAAAVVGTSSSLNATRAINSANTKVAANATATIIALTPSDTSQPTNTPTITLTPQPTRTPRATNTPRPVTATPAASPTVTTDQLIAAFESALDEFDLHDVQIADGRPNGGNLVVLISYRTRETTKNGLALEAGNVYMKTALVLLKSDIDEVGLIIVNQAGGALAIGAAEREEIIEFSTGRMTFGEFAELATLSFLGE